VNDDIATGLFISSEDLIIPCSAKALNDSLTPSEKHLCVMLPYSRRSHMSKEVDTEMPHVPGACADLLES
jgi:hypothetical protein